MLYIVRVPLLGQISIRGSHHLCLTRLFILLFCQIALITPALHLGSVLSFEMIISVHVVVAFLVVEIDLVFILFEYKYSGHYTPKYV